jgi:hypothetical protein
MGDYEKREKLNSVASMNEVEENISTAGFGQKTQSRNFGGNYDM